MKPGRISTTLLLACAVSFPALADEKEELLKLKNTTLNLIDLLVEQGILDKQKAEQMVKQAEQKATAEAKAEAQQAERQAAAEVKSAAGKGPAPVRVTYVPDFVKDEIRDQVRKELRAEVVKDVKAQAKDEKWGIPAALPDWVNRFKLSGDARLRFEDDFYSDNNLENTYIDFPRTNRAGGFTRVDNPFRNTTVDRIRYRMRLRLALDAQVSDHLKAGIRLATSNDRSPVSINQTLGQNGQQYELALDRAFLQYDYVDDSGREWLNLYGGRFANPWLSTDNLFDPDISMEGVTAGFHLPIGPASSYQVPNPVGRQQMNVGISKPNQVYLTVGAFPLQEVELESQDKWMWAAQTGVDWVFGRSTRLRTGIGYYDYKNITAQPNALGSRLNDWSAPTFFSKGNSLAQISNETDPNLEPRLVGLASDFDIVDAVVSLDYGGFGDNHVMLTGNYSENLGFDQDEILNRTGQNLKARTRAFQARFDVGRPDLVKLGDWQLWLAYKYLESDSVLDAFTDSNFHLGGTNAKGWMLGLNYGLTKNTWLNARWLTAKAIDENRKGLLAGGGAGPYDVDVLLVDLNARF